MYLPTSKTTPYLERPFNLLFPHGREEGGEMDDPVDVVVHHDGVQVLQVLHVGIHIRTWRGVARQHCMSHQELMSHQKVAKERPTAHNSIV